MTLINAIPFDGVEISSGIWRLYQQQFLSPMHINTGADGLVYMPGSNNFKVTQRAAGANMSVDVAPGAAWADGLSAWSQTIGNLTIAAAHASFTRYDLICVRADHITKEARLIVKQGVPSSTPVEPSLDKSGQPYHEIALARVTIPPGASQITNSNIDDRREFISQAPGVVRVVKNVSGQTLLPGHIVVWNEFSPTEVTLSTTAADAKVAGCMATQTANNDYGLLTVYGIGLVRLAELKGTGTRVGTSTIAGLAQENARNYIATLLDTPSVQGQAVTCWIDTSRTRESTITLVRNVQESTTLTSFAYVNGLSTTFSMYNAGKVMITVRGQASFSGEVGTQTVQFVAAIDGQISDVAHYTGVGGQVSFGGPFSFTHIFPDIFPGNHTAGLKWRVTAAGNTGFLHGNLMPTVVQIEVLL